MIGVTSESPPSSSHNRVDETHLQASGSCTMQPLYDDLTTLKEYTKVVSKGRYVFEKHNKLDLYMSIAAKSVGEILDGNPKTKTATAPSFKWIWL